MKTSELKKIVEENGYRIDIRLSNDIYIYDTVGILFNTYRVNSIQMPSYRVATTKEALFVLKALCDYCITPLDEREEEKKYILVFPKGYRKEKVYLGKVEDIGSYNNGDYLNITRLDGFYKVIFTQKEIDEMPFDTKFFEKVLVE